MRGCLERMTPVLMTALSAGVALVPLLIDAASPGKEILHPVAVTIFGGLISATLLDAFVTPLLVLRFRPQGGRAAAGCGPVRNCDAAVKRRPPILMKQRRTTMKLKIACRVCGACIRSAGDGLCAEQAQPQRMPRRGRMAAAWPMPATTTSNWSPRMARSRFMLSTTATSRCRLSGFKGLAILSVGRQESAHCAGRWRRRAK